MQVEMKTAADVDQWPLVSLSRYRIHGPDSCANLLDVGLLDYSLPGYNRWIGGKARCRLA